MDGFKRIVGVLFVISLMFVFGCGKKSDKSDPKPTCPKGFYGPNCDKVKRVDKIRLLKIVVHSFPDYRIYPGAPWDPSESGNDIYPDIYPLIYLLDDENKDLLKYGDCTPKMYKNARSRGEDYNFVPKSFYFDEPKEKYALALMDKNDTGYDNYMTQVNFVPHPSRNKFPNTIKFSDSKISLTIHIDYHFK